MIKKVNFKVLNKLKIKTKKMSEFTYNQGYKKSNIDPISTIFPRRNSEPVSYYGRYDVDKA